MTDYMQRVLVRPHHLFFETLQNSVFLNAPHEVLCASFVFNFLLSFFLSQQFRTGRLNDPPCALDSLTCAGGRCREGGCLVRKTSAGRHFSSGSRRSCSNSSSLSAGQRAPGLCCPLSRWVRGSGLERGGGVPTERHLAGVPTSCAGAHVRRCLCYRGGGHFFSLRHSRACRPAQLLICYPFYKPCACPSLWRRQGLAGSSLVVVATSRVPLGALPRNVRAFFEAGGVGNTVQARKPRKNSRVLCCVCCVVFFAFHATGCYDPLYSAIVTSALFTPKCIAGFGSVH